MSYQKNLNIYVSNICNLNCKYCYREKSKHNIKKTHSEQILEKLNEFKEKGIESIHFTGGEPLLWPELLETLRGVKKFGFMTNITTNCTIEIPEELIKLVDKFILSIDGLQNTMRVHRGIQDFHIIEKNLNKLMKNNSCIDLNVVVSKHNLDVFHSEIFKIIEKYMLKDNIGKVTILCVYSKDLKFKLENGDILTFNKNVQKLIQLLGYKINIQNNIFSKNKFLELLDIGAFKFPIWFDITEKVFYTSIKNKYNTLDDLFDNYNDDSQKLIENLLSHNNEYLDPIGGAIE
ncbi:4Fe-4S single cluster domain-containing protein [Tissierella praeacuta DSM 18095]|uniref:4Fe-4S single cluster domain-containing protein n=1 Tax=Tissierella praeacuta DSM 18095 TaxID=1123404 RepID=A0A1M4UB08_9FIRM|nr:radical SAM protein [Tissierella praeacuta]TCU77253.1 4Fe-4S single cluster protein [Tissierella praeacuta]SHE53972.1 4Fe-4S single cluster domain-containing protein [Tissierella praeacuta DSM 18095]SUP04043.1 molybdenum cofactor biosynthesis protein A [Tissierella praeacuta]